jgi:hypothetical protein
MYAQPVTQGNLVFYGTQQSAAAQDSPLSPYAGIVNQFQLGLFQDTPETYQVSKQLSKYIKGRPIEFATINSPSALFVRTDGVDNGFYVYSFIDEAGSQTREWDSWSRWQFSTAMGSVIGISQYQDKIHVFNIMPASPNGSAGGLLLVAHECTMDTTDRTAPYLDLQSGMTTAANPIVAQHTRNAAVNWSDCYASIDVTRPEFLLTESMSTLAAFQAQYPAIPLANFVGGYDFESNFTLTSPYVRDNNDKAIVNGRLNIGKYSVSFTDTTGCTVMLADITSDGKQIGAYNGRLVGHSNNLVGRVPITTSVYSVPVGRANTEHKVTFSALTGVPMTVSAIEWVGQFFTSGRRV